MQNITEGAAIFEATNFDLSGRVALVTGASSGLGAHFATVLSRAGARVVLGARRHDRVAALADAITRDGGQAIATELDVTNEASVAACFAVAESVFGLVDTVIANAGVTWSGRATEMPLEAFDQVMAVNLRGAFLTAREGGRRLIAGGAAQHGRGRIILVSSVTANRPEAGIAAYAASKAAVSAMAKALAVEWARQGVNVNVISPGYIRTEINQAWFETQIGAAQIARFPRRRLATASDLDGALLLLASDAARGITGSVFTIDDGQTL
jgi:NAD(P)-dependent dehydrogenase (short-subunit alcohol dehydrogenase family)